MTKLLPLAPVWVMAPAWSHEFLLTTTRSGPGAPVYVLDASVTETWWLWQTVAPDYRKSKGDRERTAGVEGAALHDGELDVGPRGGKDEALAVVEGVGVVAGGVVVLVVCAGALGSGTDGSGRVDDGATGCADGGGAAVEVVRPSLGLR